MFSFKENQGLSDFLLLISRISIAALMLTHGMPKFFKLIEGGEIQFADPIFIGPTLSLLLVVFSEVICSVLIAIGYKLRLATLPLIFTMLVAAFVVHVDDGIYKQEKALLYIISYLLLMINGAGKYSLDYLQKRKS